MANYCIPKWVSQRGARVRAETQRREALAAYEAKPKFCLECGKKIEIGEFGKVSNKKKNNFCNYSCAKTYDHKRKRKERGLPDYIPHPPHRATVAFKKKSEVNPQQINQVARVIYDTRFTRRECEICKYNTVVEIAHIRPVREFSEDALLIEINCIANLIGLCPNHHKEFDRGFLPIAKIEAAVAKRKKPGYLK